MLNKYLVEFLGTLFFVYIVLATGNAIAIGALLPYILAQIGGGLVALELFKRVRL